MFETGAEEVAYDKGLNHGIEMGKSLGEAVVESRISDWLIARICFDYETNGSCDHQVCYGFDELLEKIEMEK